MRSALYELVALSCLVGSGVAFYECVYFLAGKQYITGIACLLIGFAVLRVGVNLSRLAVAIRRDSSQS